MSKNQLTLVYSILLLSALLMPTFAVTQEEPAAVTVYSLQGDNQQTYLIPWSVLDAGGKVEEAISANYRLKDAIGQPEIGKCENSNYRLYVGFLAAPEYVEKAIDVEHVTIGSGTHCFSFAIFADPQSDIGKLNDAITWVNRNYVAEKIKFVIVASDLIQGEKASGYDNDFTAIKDALNNNLNPNVRWIPEPGNHDYWCNLAGTPIHRPDCTSIPEYTDATYPEEHFNVVFGPVYTPLADLAGWTKQGGMPIPNAHGYAPPTYFQNFVFDYGDYHFVCLDLCARDDFNPGPWTIITTPFGPITFPQFQFGYADTHDDYGNDGTIKWFEDHLEKYGYCDPDTGYDRGYKRSKNIILISHHAPIFNLKGTGTYDPTTGPIPITWELQNENTYGFKQTEYNNLVSLLNSLSSSHDFNYRWFTGHYERKDMEWIDTEITPNTPVKVIASVQPLSWVPPIPGLVIDPTITINNVHSVTTEDNLNGQITIVKVLSPGGTDPDPSIYSQLYTINHPADPASPPPPVTWDSPDIELYDQSGSFVPSGNLNWGQQYEIRARIYNKGCSDANINVRFKWSKAALNWMDKETGFTTGNVIGPIPIPSGEERVVRMQYWDASIVAPGPGPTTIHACVRAVIEPLNMDSNSNNNYGTENCDVHNCQTSASDEVIDFSFPIMNPANITNGITVDVYPGVGTLWNPEIVLPELAPGEEGNVTLRLDPIPGVARNVGDSEIFSLTARRLDTNETTGGLEVTVVVDDSPILEWTGDIGYQIDGVEPDEGNAGDTFIFRVMYKDENNHAPASGYPLLYLFKGDEQIEGRPVVMNEEDPTDTVYTDGKIYTYSVTLSKPGDDYTYYSWARDSFGIGATGPATQIKEGPIVKEVPIPPTSLKEFFVTGDPDGNVYIYWSDNDGTFIRSKIGDVTNSGTTPGSCAGAAIADYDHDGDLDVFMGNSNRDTGDIWLFENIGNRAQSKKSVIF